MARARRFDDRRTVEFVGGPWCGMPYTPVIGEELPPVFHVPSRDEVHVYELRTDGGRRYQHCGRLTPEGQRVM
jgi:hypothetical protein